MSNGLVAAAGFACVNLNRDFTKDFPGVTFGVARTTIAKSAGTGVVPTTITVFALSSAVTDVNSNAGIATGKGQCKLLLRRFGSSCC